MRKLGKGTLLLVSAVMAASLFTGCGKESSQKTTTKKKEVYATIKKSDQSMTAEEICAWLDYGVRNYTQFQNEVMELSYCSDDLAVFQILLEVWFMTEIKGTLWHLLILIRWMRSF